MLNLRNTLGTGRLTQGRFAALGGLMALAAALLLATSVGAQEAPDQEDEATIVGHVVDSETGAALVGAWVGLTGTEWGSISNPEGRFRIPDHGDGMLDVTVEMLGYRTVQWRGEVSADEFVQIEMMPEPILLEGLEVMTDRFRSRRNAVPTSVFAFDADDLTRATSLNARDFIAAQSGVFYTVCNGTRGSSCIWSRGRRIEPVVYVDEFPHIGGLDYLATFSPAEFHMIEVYNRGAHIRVYTPSFMKRAAEQRMVPIPLTAMGGFGRR